MIKLSKYLTLIFTDYNAALRIIKQILLFTSFTNKLNIRLI